MSNSGVDPVQGGASVRRADGEAGTCACVVESQGDPGQRYILSNAHVLAIAGQTSPAIGDPVFPGAAGPGSIGTLTKWSELLTGDNLTDAAIALLDNPDSVDTAIADLGEPVYDPQVQAFPDMRVRMRGAPGLIITGKVLTTNHEQVQSMHFPVLGDRKPRFIDQVLFKYDTPQPNLLFGFSGSAVLDDDNHLLGLFWMGSQNFGVFCKINHVFETFQVQLAGTANVSPPAPTIVGDTGNATDLLAKTIWGEARGEVTEGKEAVASVVLNRAARRPRMWWGSSVEIVCLKPFQFSCWNPNDPNREKLDSAHQTSSFPDCLAVAQTAVDGRLTDRTNGATHYHDESITPDWAAGKTPSAVIGSHRFYNSIE